MTNETPKNTTLADQVFGSLVKRILTGEAPPLENLPPERAMAEQFGVTRHVVREAIKRLQQAGLVQVVHGGGNRVQDFHRTAGLDLLELVANYVPLEDALWTYWLPVLELRVEFADIIARQCAVRAPAHTRERLLGMVDRMRAESDDEALLALDEEFWSELVDGTENVVVRLIYNTLLAASRRTSAVTAAMVARELRDNGFQQELAVAIAEGDEDTAGRAARATMEHSLDQLRRAREARGRAAQQAP